VPTTNRLAKPPIQTGPKTERQTGVMLGEWKKLEPQGVENLEPEMQTLKF
jgi:hypothetical protein